MDRKAGKALVIGVLLLTCVFPRSKARATEPCILIETCACGATADDFMDGAKCASTNNKAGMQQLVLTGRIGLLAKGTIVFVTDVVAYHGIALVKVKPAGVNGTVWTAARCVRCK